MSFSGASVEHPTATAPPLVTPTTFRNRLRSICLAIRDHLIVTDGAIRGDLFLLMTLEAPPHLQR